MENHQLRLELLMNVCPYVWIENQEAGELRFNYGLFPFSMDDVIWWVYIQRKIGLLYLNDFGKHNL